jgi:NAD(P)-dependent dehydrogenase (short-subunit alcohol dehydrogenase family)
VTRTWFVTGAARGFGLEIAKAALSVGDNVIATARKSGDIAEALPDAGKSLLAQSLDVTDPEAPQRAAKAALEHFDRIDVLVNNAGYGQLGIFEESSEEDVRRQFETNVFGLMSVTRAVLPVMRRQRSGHIINISSIAGLLPADLCTLYGASKFAVEGFSINLAREIEPLGIRVTVVEPGMFRTDFLDPSSAHFSGNAIDDYEQQRKQLGGQYEASNHQQPGDPTKLGTAIVELTNAETPPLRLLLGSDALDLVPKALTAQSSEIDAWAHLSATTDHEDTEESKK